MRITKNWRETTKLELAAEILASGSSVWIKALGTSMLPAIWPGDLLEVQGAAPEDVARGDMVLIVQEQRFYLHRVREIEDSRGRKRWTTRGDALLNNDPPVRASGLLGRVTQIRRNGRTSVPTRPSGAARLLSYLVARHDVVHNLLIRLYGYSARCTSAQFASGSSE